MAALTIVGPAGTGKTEACIGLVKDWLGGGAGPEEVAYVAFTKDAAKQAACRVVDEAVPEKEFKEAFRFFRTIHSLCYWAYRQAEENRDRRVMTSTDWKRFSEQTGIRGSFEAASWDDLADVYLSVEKRGRKDWSDIQTAYTVSRITAASVAELDAARMRPSDKAILLLDRLIPGDQYSAFVRLYEQYKAKEGLIDFTDMLEYGLRAMEPLPIRYAVVDECQDLSPLMDALVERLMSSADLLVRAGDDMQAIYSWAGADARLFLKHARQNRRLVLRRTHRFGQPIVDFADKIVRRVKDRIDRDVIGLPKGASVSTTGNWSPRAGRHFVLHRHVAGCQEIAKRHIVAGIPFRNERGRSPLTAANRVRAYKYLKTLREGKRLELAKARDMIEELLPSMVPVEESAKLRLVVHGAKKRLAESAQHEELELGTLVQRKILTEHGARAIREGRFTLMRHSEDLSYYARIEENGHKLDADAGPTITTIHGSKGRQAPFTVVYTEMSQRCWKDVDTEHRVAYVAATRTEGDLVLAHEPMNDWMTEHYPYPA